MNKFMFHGFKIDRSLCTVVIISEHSLNRLCANFIYANLSPYGEITKEKLWVIETSCNALLNVLRLFHQYLSCLTLLHELDSTSMLSCAPLNSKS